MMIRRYALGFFVLAGLSGLLGAAVIGKDSASQGTEPPPGGWANLAPTLVERVVDRKATQLLEVSQGDLRTWIQIPQIDATPGDYVLLGQGEFQPDAEIPELSQRVPGIVNISHAQVVDYETAQQSVRTSAPPDAIRIAHVYTQLDQLADSEIIIYGTVVKAPQAIGWHWVHLQDGSGDASLGTHDLTVKTAKAVTVGQRVAFRGTLRKDVDLGFGYHYDALVEGGVKVVHSPSEAKDESFR